MSQAVIRLYESVTVINRRVHARLKKPDGRVGEFDVQRAEVKENGGLPADKVPKSIWL